MNALVIILLLVFYSICRVLETYSSKNIRTVGIFLKTIMLLCLTVVVFNAYLGNSNNIKYLKEIAIDFKSINLRSKNINLRSNSALYFITLILYLKNFLDIIIDFPRDLGKINND